LILTYLDCSNEVEQDDVDEDTLELPEQEEEDLNRIKEESRRRREAIMEKYKKQNQQIQQAAGNEEKGIIFSLSFIKVHMRLRTFLTQYVTLPLNYHLSGGRSIAFSEDFHMLDWSSLVFSLLLLIVCFGPC
jgi:predicted ATP-dependent protease